MNSAHRIGRRLVCGLVAASAGAWAAQATAANLDCEPEPQLAVERIEARTILVGESHGTAQAPAFVGRLLCSLLRAGRPVVFAVERGADEQPALDRFLASAGQPADRAALLAERDWAAGVQDGRSSAAMLALFERVRAWKQAGAPITVLAMRQPAVFDDAQPDPKQLQMRDDRGMAESVAAAQQAHAGHTTVVLAGSFHTVVGSKMHQDIIGGPSMGDLIAERGPVHVIGLSNSRGGTAWLWQSGEPAPGVHPAPAGRFDLPDARIDRSIDLGEVTASRPARELTP